MHEEQTDHAKEALELRAALREKNKELVELDTKSRESAARFSEQVGACRTHALRLQQG